MKVFCLAWLLAWISLDVRADVAGESLELKLPDAKTGVIFQLSKVDPQLTLLSFWQTDCEYCLKDMALLSVFSTQHPDLRMLGISVSELKVTRDVWQQQKVPFPTLINDGFPGVLLKRFGNPVGAVPYTVILNWGRQLCWSAIGQITAEQLDQGLVACRIRA